MCRGAEVVLISMCRTPSCKTSCATSWSGWPVALAIVLVGAGTVSHASLSITCGVPDSCTPAYTGTSVRPSGRVSAPVWQNLVRGGPCRRSGGCLGSTSRSHSGVGPPATAAPVRKMVAAVNQVRVGSGCCCFPAKRPPCRQRPVLTMCRPAHPDGPAGRRAAGLTAAPRTARQLCACWPSAGPGWTLSF